MTVNKVTMSLGCSALMYTCALTVVIQYIENLDIKFDTSKETNIVKESLKITSKEPTSSKKIVNLLELLCQFSPTDQVYYFLTLLKYALSYPNEECSRVNFMNL